jgi:uncharacterized repeat protein (TIGR03803 family)
MCFPIQKLRAPWSTPKACLRHPNSSCTAAIFRTASLKLDSSRIFAQHRIRMAKIPPGILAWITLVLVESTVAGAMPEYAAAESKKHIGETARVTGKVDFVDAHRRSHILSLGGCEPKMDFYVRVPYGVPGPDLNVTELKGGVITVSEKMEKSEVDDLPFIDVTSTSQIVPHKLQKAQAEVKQEQPVADPPQTNAPAEAPAGEKQTSPHGSYTRPADAKGLPAGTNILGSPAEPGIADVTALVEFTGNGATNKGSGPNGLIFASDGDIYGTTERGGANDYGTVFKMTPAGALSTIVEFAGNAPVNSSGFPMAPLIERRDGDFYGTTSGGGVGPTGENNLDNGTIFKLSRSGVLTTLVRFSCNGATNKGCTPYSGLVEAPNGDFYGTTFSGGSGKAVPIPGFRGFGTIYKMSPAGLLTTLYDFSGHVAKGQGGSPWAGLTLGKDRNFYGNTWLGGAGHAGTIFKMTPRGAMTTLVNFSGFKPPKKGGGCVAELVQASDGNFYGTCPIGGGGNGGTVFKMTPSGAFTNLVEFSNNDPKGAQPHAPLAEGNDGNLYGTTTVGGAYNYGTIFGVTPSGLFKVLWNFNNPNKIHECQHPGTGPLLKDKEGNFYGTTKWGGRSDWGTVFKLTLHNSDMQASTAPPDHSPSRATPQPAQMEQAQSSAALHDFKTAKQKLIAQDAAYHEYSAAEAYKHIGETARLTGMVDCLGNGRRHTDVQIGGCLPYTLLWVVVPNDASGLEMDLSKLLGVTITVTGKIESSGKIPQVTVKSTTQIVPGPSPEPNYFASASEKEFKPDLDGATADLDRAIEQTHDPGAYIQRARVKEKKADFAGAIRDYDELIERSVDTYAVARAEYYDGRAKLKIKNGDFDGAIADADAAIRLNPSVPWHYVARGQADEAKGDFAAAIKDYQLAIKTEPHNSVYKDMLRKAQAKASQKHEPLLNKSQVTPESIAQAFVQAYSSADVDAVAGLYADRVDYTNSGVISNAAVRAQAEEYFARWPVRHWSLAGSVNTVSLGSSKQKIIFSASYDVSDPQRNKHTSGIAKETLIVVSDASGAMKIVSQKEQISKKGSSQPSEETATSGSGMMWSELSPDKGLLATIRFVPNPDKNWRAFDELKIAVFRQGRDGKPGQILASTAIGGRFLQSAHWSPDSQFLLFTTSPSRGGHGGWHFETFVYCARDHSFRGDLEDVFGNVLAPDFGFESPDIAVLTVSDDQAPSTAGEEPPTKQVKVSLGKVVDKLDRLP